MSLSRSFVPLTFILLGLMLLAGWTAAAQEESTEGPEAGRELAAQLRSMRPPEDAKWRGTLKIRHHGQATFSVPIMCETTAPPGQSDWSVMYLASSTAAGGARKLTVIHSVSGPNQYILATAPVPDAPLDPPKTLAAAQADIPLAGSDFWLSDLGFEFYHWPEQRRLKGEMRRGKPCYVLESVNPHPLPEGYSRVVSWVERESGAPIQAEAYGADGKLLKEFALGSVKKVNDRWELKDLEISNRKTGSRTHLVCDLE